MSIPCELTDTHAHLDMARFEGDLDEVVERARRAGVTRIICVGIDPPSSREAVSLAHRYRGIHAAVGIHPEAACHTTRQDIEAIAALAGDSRVVAIGEIGLDFYRDYGPREKQIEVFRQQFELASRLALPVIIHARQAENELAPLLSSWRGDHPKNYPGVIHCFNGSLAAARAYIDLGFYISLGGYIGYPSAKGTRAVAAELPLDKLLIETDSPFLPPQLRRGERNEPSYVTETANELARLKGISFEDTAYATTNNALQIFGGLPG